MLTRDRMMELLMFDGQEFFWKVPRQGRQVGQQAGSTRKDGYVSITLDQKKYYKHHLVWLFHTGGLPVELDHIDRNPNNNHISNLRAVTRQQNMINRRAPNGGVSLDKRFNKWYAALSVNKKQVFLGSFKTVEEARDCYDKTAREWFGEFYSGRHPPSNPRRG